MSENFKAKTQSKPAKRAANDSRGETQAAERQSANGQMDDAVQARIAVEESEERYRALLASAPMAVFVCDRDGVIQYYNARAVELWGREPERGVERHCGSERLWLPDGKLLPHAQSPIVEVLRTGISVHNVEVFIGRPDGSRLPVLVNIAALKNAEGEITGAITSCQDISERKRMEAQREQFFNLNSALLVEAGFDGRLHRLNPAWERRLGWTAEEMTSRPWLDFVHPDDQAATAAAAERLFAGDEVVNFENRYRHKDGSWRWLNWNTSPAPEYQMIYGVAEDITERKRTEANLAFLAEVSQDLAGLTNVEDTMNALGAKIGEYFNAPLVAFAEVDEPQEVATVNHAWNHADLPSLRGVYRISDFHTEYFRQASRAGETYVVRDAATDPRTDAEALATLNIVSFVSAPLLRERRWCFQLTVFDATPRDWRDDEVELMRELTARIWTRLERARAEEALRESEERFRRVFSNNMAPMGVWTKVGGIISANDALLDLIGYTREELETGQINWVELTPPEYHERDLQAVAEVEANGSCAPYEKIYFHKNGRPIPIVICGGRFDERTGAGIFFAVDITERKRAEALQVEQGRLLEMIASGRPLKECLDALTDSVARLQPNVRAAVLLANADRSAMAGCYSARLEPTFGAPIAGLPINELAIGTCGTAIFKGAPVTCADIAHSEEWSQPWRELCVAHGVLAGHSQPVFGSEGKAVASFFMAFAEAREPDAREWRLAEFGAHIASIVIERDRAAQGLRESETRLAAELADMKQLQRISSQLIRENNINALYEQIIEAAIALMRSDMGSIQMLYPERNELRLLAWKGFAPASAVFWEWVRVDSGTSCGMALRTGERVITPDVEICEPIAGAEDLDFFRLSGIRATQSTPLVSRSGRIVGMISTHWREPHHPSERDLRLLDVLARQAADLIERRQAEQALRQSEERFRTMADNISQFAWMADGKGWIFWYNQRWFEYTGATLEEMQGWGWKKVHHPDHVDRVVERIQRSWDTGEAWEDTFPLRGKDGKYRWFLSRALPIRDERGEIVRWFGTNTDVTEQRAAQESLKEADRRKDEFLAMLAHELRNPLAPILNAAQVLEVADSPEADQQLAREVIARQTQHLTRLVDDLLDVSRITQGKVTIAREPLELSSIIARAVETSRPLIDARRHQLNVTLPAEPLHVEGDLTRLVQIVANLLNNAAKYTGEGGRIQLEATRAGEEVVICVRDDGMGLPADLLPHVFDLFMQADRSLDRSQGGLGIGLTLVRSLVELHGGRVEARSAGPGQGSEFVVRLPALAAGLVTGAAEQAAARAQTAQHALKVLIVEDNVDSAEMMRLMLKFDGYEAQTAHDGPSALEAARSFEPQVVLCDIGLPGMNGYEVAERLRQQPALKRTPLIALTGYGQKDARRRAQEAGFDHHLVKPVEPKALRALLASLHSTARGE